MARGGPGEAGRQARGVTDAGSTTGGVGRGAEWRKRCLARPPFACPAASAVLIVVRCRSPPGSRGFGAPTRGGAPARQRRQRGVVGGGEGRRRAGRAATVTRGAVRERPSTSWPCVQATGVRPGLAGNAVSVPALSRRMGPEDCVQVARLHGHHALGAHDGSVGRKLRPPSAMPSMSPARNADQASSSARRLSRNVDRE